MNRTRLYAVGLFVVLLACLSAQAAVIPVKSKVEAVTLYRGQALVTREVILPEEAGELELVVSDLPAQVVGASLHASGGDGVIIRSVRFRSRAVADEPKKEVADLDAQIKRLNRRLQANGEMAKLLEMKAQFIGKLEGFTAAAAKTDVEKAVLDPGNTAEMTSQIFDQRTKLTEDHISLREDAEDIKEEIALLQRRRNELARGSNRTVREAVIFISKAARGEGAIRLMYLVNSATWSPAYNIRMANDNKSITVEYLAQVQQMSGEDWAGVELTLSTATPAMNSQSPLLVPLWINLAGVDVGKAEGTLGYAEFADRQDLMIGGQRQYLSAWQNPAGRGEMERANWELNRFAAEQQRLELNVKGKIIRAGAAARRSMEEGLAVSYDLPGAMSLASRSDSQLVQIARIDLPTESYHVAIPVLSTYVYRIGKVTNTSSLPLLAGRYSAYVGGEFVGRGRLSLVARGQRFTIGLGVDTQVRCRRELMDKSDQIVWGSRVQKFNYRLRVENYKDKAVPVRLLDRMPTTRADEIRISLGKLSDKLSTDEVYVRDFKDRGILRWNLTVPAKAAAARARDVTYNFEMKYAKDVHIGKEAVAATKEMQASYGHMLLSQ